MNQFVSSPLKDEDLPLRHRINAGRHAITSLLGLFRSQLGNVRSSWKEDDSRVTFMDFAISEKIFAELRQSFPLDDYCSEEFSPDDETTVLKREFAWVLDPIDGTNNYALGIPFAAISLALLRGGMPVYGFIYDYARDRIIEGGAGLGLKVGTRRIHRKFPEMTNQSIIALHFPLSRHRQDLIQPLTETYRVRATGSCALNLAYTAIGTFDGYLEQGSKIWDFAAAWALCEAGGIRVQPSGPNNPFPLREFHVRSPKYSLLAGHSAFFEELAINQIQW